MTGATTTTKRLQAVIYMRVSTRDQAQRDGAIEGYSIPAQRDANIRAAEGLGADVVREFVDAGESARSADRPALQEMLEFVRDNAISYVIVHKIDRLARNRADDVSINIVLQAAGAKLVSATESIDETPSGMLMHGIMSSIAEFYSQNLAAEVKKGMRQKVKAGGTVGRAPLGYRNVRHFDELNREIRTVEKDPVRAPMIAYAFERYATGETTVALLAAELADRGLATQPTPRRASRAIYPQLLYKVLTNPYYRGVVSSNGVIYEGRHEALVSSATWSRVQEILSSHNNGEKNRLFPHYLRGSAYCARCKRRMIVHNAKGNGGVYPYLVCIGRHRKTNDCDMRAVLIDDVEDEVVDLYRSVVIPVSIAEPLQERLLAEMEAANEDVKALRRDLTLQRDRLEDRRRKLVDAHLAGAIPVDLMREEQDRLTAELVGINNRLAGIDVEFESMQRTLAVAIDITTDCFEMYRIAPDWVRRLLNQAFFVRIEVDVEEEELIVTGELAEPFKSLHDLTKVSPSRRQTKPPTGIKPVGGSNNAVLVDPRGFEPLTSSMRTRRATNCAKGP